MKNKMLMEIPRLIPSRVFEDDRGWFYEAFNSNNNQINRIFVQDNHSLTRKKNTIRGLHLQLQPFNQAKLVRVLKGSIMDVVVDLRISSESYLNIWYFNLDSFKKTALYVPSGFAHGYITKEDYTEVYYKVDQYYSPNHEITIRFDDENLSIKWGESLNFILSDKDNNGLYLYDAIALLGDMK
jgi:dTDP-4-dehydrorhamnose 3,5-epimerase